MGRYIINRIKGSAADSPFHTARHGIFLYIVTAQRVPKGNNVRENRVSSGVFKAVTTGN